MTEQKQCIITNEDIKKLSKKMAEKAMSWCIISLIIGYGAGLLVRIYLIK